MITAILGSIACCYGWLEAGSRFKEDKAAFIAWWCVGQAGLACMLIGLDVGT